MRKNHPGSDKEWGPHAWARVPNNPDKFEVDRVEHSDFKSSSRLFFGSQTYESDKDPQHIAWRRREVR